MTENLLLNQPLESHSTCSGIEIDDKAVTDFLGTEQEHKYFLFVADFNWIMSNALKGGNKPLGLIYICFYTSMSGVA